MSGEKSPFFLQVQLVIRIYNYLVPLMSLVISGAAIIWYLRNLKDIESEYRRERDFETIKDIESEIDMLSRLIATDPLLREFSRQSKPEL